MTSWHTYPKLYSLGHRAIAELLLDDVVVEEKLDGSQFSFGVFEEVVSSSLDHCETAKVLKIRSKGAVLHIDAPEKMFGKAVDTVKDLAARGLLREGWTYRAEYLAKPKHNTLAYDRVPGGYLAIFDINIGEESYLDYSDKANEARRLGLEVVPLIYSGRVMTVDQFRTMLDRVSFLGGAKIEGVVVKNYSRFGADKKVLMGKFVSEAFKEIHGGEWRAANPSRSDVVDALIQSLKTPARWAKAAQHLRERGQLTDSPKDIGALIKEVQADVEAEASDEIKQRLFDWAIGQIRRGVIGGLPEWWKDELLKKQFEQEAVLTPEQALEIYYTHGIDTLLDDREEVDLLEEHNPLLLEAYRALAKLAEEAPE